MDSQSNNNVGEQLKSFSPIQNNSANPLHVVIALGLPTSVREIIDHNPELALSFDENGLTPFHLAVANGDISVIKELLDSNVGVDICCLRDKNGFLPIHIAVMKGSVDILKVVSDTCRMYMFQETTWQGDSILHLALKFNSLEAFYYLWHLFSADKKFLNSRDAEGNTLLHIAVARRQIEVVKMLGGKIDMNIVNLNGSTALGMFFNSRYEDLTLEEMIIRADWKRPTGHELSEPQIPEQPNHLHSEESITHPSSAETCTNTSYHLWRKISNFGRASLRQAPSDNDREASNAMMVVATLIAALTFQSALNPPGGFINDGKDMGMAVNEIYLIWYLFFDIMAFICSLSVILATIYIVPKWKDIIKLVMYIIWISVFFTYMSFHFGAAVIFGHIIHHPLIAASLYIGRGIVVVFAFVMFIYSWYRLHKSMSTFLPEESTKGIIGRSKIVVITCLAFLLAALVWLPFVMWDISMYYYM